MPAKYLYCQFKPIPNAVNFNLKAPVPLTINSWLGIFIQWGYTMEQLDYAAYHSVFFSNNFDNRHMDSIDSFKLLNDMTYVFNNSNYFRCEYAET